MKWAAQRIKPNTVNQVLRKGGCSGIVERDGVSGKGGGRTLRDFWRDVNRLVRAHSRWFPPPTIPPPTSLIPYHEIKALSVVSNNKFTRISQKQLMNSLIKMNCFGKSAKGSKLYYCSVSYKPLFYIPLYSDSTYSLFIIYLNLCSLSFNIIIEFVYKTSVLKKQLKTTYCILKCFTAVLSLIKAAFHSEYR